MAGHRSSVAALARRWYMSLVAVPVFAALLAAESTRTFALVNLVVQLLVFVPASCLPGWRTKRMSYVDIGWPWGLVAIGMLTLVFSERTWFAVGVAIAYLVMGLRMGLGALKYLREGEFGNEMPRYRYQRMRWETASLGDERRDVVAEILVQAWANSVVLAVPASLAVADRSSHLAAVTVAGFALWALSWVLESVADMQKLAFVRGAQRGECCEAGMWGYSRHPNYFFQWMQWTWLAVACTPAMVHRYDQESAVVAVVLTLGLALTSLLMLWCLIWYTGAIPAEYYSAAKRPAYREYQSRVNRFVPGPPRRT